MLWLGVLLLSTLAVARWPDRIVADARGVRWIDEDGASRFFENENALVVHGSIPWVREVVCERDGVRNCDEALERAGGQARLALMFYPGRCIQMRCSPVPSTDKIEIAFPDFVSLSEKGDTSCTEDGLCQPKDRTPFNPDKFVVNLRAVQALSLLWHIK